jgi:hypothetical protein
MGGPPMQGQNLQQMPQQQMQQQMQQPQMQQQMQQPQMQQMQQPQMQHQQLPQQQMQQQMQAQQLPPQQQMQQRQLQQLQQPHLQQHPQGAPMGSQMMQPQLQQPQEPTGVANGAASVSKQVDKPTLEVGMQVDAQCVGWGDEFYPGTIRELLPSGEVQILWDGDDPSISNCPPELVTPRQQAAAAPSANADKASSDNNVQINSSTVASPVVDQVNVAPAATPVVPQTISAVASGDGHGQKRPLQEAADNELSAANAVAAVVQRSYRYDLGPGDEIESPISNLRRRVEAELRDGLSITISLHIVREPDAGVPPAPATSQVVTAPSRTAAAPNGASAPHSIPAQTPQTASMASGAGAGVTMPKASPGVAPVFPSATGPVGTPGVTMPGVPNMPSIPAMPQIPSMPGMSFTGMGGAGPLNLVAPGMMQQGGAMGMAKMQ